MSKKSKKLIVNGLTLTRVLTTISMPVLATFLSSSMFLLVIGVILFTDFLDGKLARKWEVSTIFGSLFDMTADKLLGIGVLSALSFTYPIMLVPLMLELTIGSVNIKGTLKGGVGSSSQIGRAKTWIMGLTVFSLLLIGASPELSESLSNIDFSNSLFSNALKELNEIMIKGLSFITMNKETIEKVAIPSTIVSEGLTLLDYKIEYDKVKDNDKVLTKDDLIKYKEYIKKVILDEEYYKKTKDLPFYEKIIPPEHREEIKKLTLNKNSLKK